MYVERFSLKKPAIAVHGGAGDWAIDSEGGKRVCEKLRGALETGFDVLIRGGSAVDAVVEAVAALEDSGIFNAGSGSALNSKGYGELDAGVMDGSTMFSGAVAAVRVRNPVRLARMVMDRTSHVILCCDDAEALARALGMSIEPFRPGENQVKRYRDLISRLGSEDAPIYVKANREIIDRLLRSGVHGTVGAVAIDNEGRLAAATSTGGVWLKLPGRVGDTPIPGAGFYADRDIACSATGIGETIMTISLCRSIALASRFMGSVLSAIAYSFEELESLPRYRGYAQAGVIIITRNSDLYMAYNTKGMARGYVSSDKSISTAVFQLHSRSRISEQ